MPIYEGVAFILHFLGASSGIGAATALLFSKLKASLVLTGRNSQALAKIAAQCQQNGITVSFFSR